MCWNGKRAISAGSWSLFRLLYLRHSGRHCAGSVTLLKWDLSPPSPDKAHHTCLAGSGNPPPRDWHNHLSESKQVEGGVQGGGVSSRTALARQQGRRWVLSEPGCLGREARVGVWVCASAQPTSPQIQLHAQKDKRLWPPQQTFWDLFWLTAWQLPTAQVLKGDITGQIPCELQSLKVLFQCAS